MGSTTEERIGKLVAESRQLRDGLKADVEALDAERRTKGDQLRGLDAWLTRFDPTFKPEQNGNGKKKLKRGRPTGAVGKPSFPAMRAVLDALLADATKGGDGLTRRELCETTGFGRSSVEKALAGLRHPPYEHIYSAGLNHNTGGKAAMTYKPMKGAESAKLDANS